MTSYFVIALIMSIGTLVYHNIFCSLHITSWQNIQLLSKYCTCAETICNLHLGTWKTQMHETEKTNSSKQQRSMQQVLIICYIENKNDV